MDHETKQYVKQKQSICRLFRLGLISKEYYKKICNETRKKINIRKNVYYKRKLSGILDTGNRWKTLKECANITNNRQPLTIKQITNSNGNILVDAKSIANELNNHFISVGIKTQETIELGGDPYSKFLGVASRDNFQFLEATPAEVIQIITSLKTSRSLPVHVVPPHCFKLAKLEISSTISSLINQSFKDGCFPESLKHARITPLYKTGNPSLPCNYRPISILSVLSKIFEKAAHKRLYEHFTSHNLLHRNQFGFRKNHNTTDTLIIITNTIKVALNNKQSAICVYLDLSKAFDTVPHDVLLGKLHHYGVRGVELRWFENYLSARSQVVQIQDTASDKKRTVTGIPQGSNLGPLLFSIMINDIFNCTSLKTVGFADDLTVIAVGYDLGVLEHQITNGLKNISDWLASNKLKLNINKTKYTIFTNKKIARSVKIQINNQSLQEVEHFKLLGVQIDKRLNFSTHTSILRRKLAYCSFIMSRFPKQLDISDKKRLYFAYANSICSYGIELWGGAPRVYISKIARIQRKLVRRLRPERIETSESLFGACKIMDINNLYKYRLGCYMYKVKNSLCPRAVQDIFENRVVHMHDTREANAERVPRARISLLQKDITWTGPKIWNTIDIEIKGKNPTAFKSAWKRHLLTMQ